MNTLLFKKSVIQYHRLLKLIINSFVVKNIIMLKYTTDKENNFVLRK